MTDPLDVTKWTDEELAAEMAAWGRGGECARLPAIRSLEASVEYDRRVGRTACDEYYNAFLTRLRDARAEATLSST